MELVRFFLLQIQRTVSPFRFAYWTWVWTLQTCSQKCPYVSVNTCVEMRSAMASWQGKSVVAKFQHLYLPWHQIHLSGLPYTLQYQALNHEHSLEILVLLTTRTFTGDTCTPYCTNRFPNSRYPTTSLVQNNRWCITGASSLWKSSVRRLQKVAFGLK